FLSPPPLSSPLFLYTTLFRSDFITTVKVAGEVVVEALTTYLSRQKTNAKAVAKPAESQAPEYKLNNEWNISENTGRRYAMTSGEDRKSTRLNSSHVKISYAVF